MSINTASKMLTDAAKVLGERRGRYGAPSKNFKTIASLWQAYLIGKYGELATLRIDEADVAVMSACIKIARLAETPDHDDSWTDLAGYAACGFQVTRKADPAPEKSETNWAYGIAWAEIAKSIPESPAICTCTNILPGKEMNAQHNIDCPWIRHRNLKAGK